MQFLGLRGACQSILRSGAGGTTTVLGVQVNDSDPLSSTETFGVTPTTGATALGTSITPSASSGSLAGINSVFASGVTYPVGATDIVNFVFNQAGTGPNIALQGTSGKDVIFKAELRGLTNGLPGALFTLSDRAGLLAPAFPSCP